MSEARRRFYDGGPSDVSFIVTDDDIDRNVPEHFPTNEDYSTSVIMENTPEGKVVGEMMITKRPWFKYYIIKLWLEDD